MCINAKAVERLIEAARKNGVFLMEGVFGLHPFTYHLD
jgi:predicted dehydrogenase